ncbi:hypothetical protein NHQ30_003390 [Ciborinia camelliae]|nr:hypothetical protein NHQ30_003390 [Ciborinia camelliae]
MDGAPPARTPLPSSPLRPRLSGPSLAAPARTPLPSGPRVPGARTPLPSAPISATPAPAAPALVAPAAAVAQGRAVQRPYVNRAIFSIDRVKMTEIELAAIRRGYPELLGRKACFKNSPGEKKSVEITMEELTALQQLRGTSAQEVRAYDARRARNQESRERASNYYKRELERKREEGRNLGRPGTLSPADRVVPAALPSS